jgi:MSHA biogenesis protein MshN
VYAQLLAARGEFDQALEALGRITEAQPPDSEAFALRAAIFARLDRHENAASDYRLALKLDPGQANWWMGLGLALEHQELYGSASDAYQKASRLPATDSVRAFVHERLGQLKNISGDG